MSSGSDTEYFDNSDKDPDYIPQDNSHGDGRIHSDANAAMSDSDLSGSEDINNTVVKDHNFDQQTSERKHSSLLHKDTSNTLQESANSESITVSSQELNSNEVHNGTRGSTRPQQKRIRIPCDKTYSRRKVDCPLNCGSKVINLPRHMRNSHNYNDNMAKNVLTFHNIRKDTRKMPSNLLRKKDYHKRTACPVAGCYAIVKRLSDHLKHAHTNTHTQPTERPQDGDTTEEENDAEDCGEDIEFEGEPAPLTQVLHSFRQYLRTPAGSNLDRKSVKQHSRQIELLLELVNTRDHREIFKASQLNRAFYKVLKGCRATNRRARKARTLKSYSGSLIHFANFFMLNRRVDSFATTQYLTEFKVKVANLSKSMRRQSTREATEVLDRDSLRVPEVHDYVKYIKSDVRKNIITELEEAARNERFQYSQKVYTRIVGFLLFEMMIGNCNRTGEMLNMTVDEFNSCIIEGEFGIIYVKDYKTYYKYGKQDITIPKFLHTHLRVYLHIIRPTVQNAESPDKLFISSAGKELCSSSVSQHMTTVWQAAGLETSISPTLIRKSGTTIICDAHPELAKALACKMKHSTATQGKYYCALRRGEKSAAMGRVLRGIMTNNEGEGSSGLMSTKSSASATKASINYVSNFESDDEVIPPTPPNEDQQLNFSLPSVQPPPSPPRIVYPGVNRNPSTRPSSLRANAQNILPLIKNYY